MKLLTVILFCGLLNAQEVEITSVVHSVVSGYSVYYQMRDRELYRQGDVEYKKYNSLWHYAQSLELGLSLPLGTAISENHNIIDISKDVVLFSAIRWLVRDGVYNMLNGHPFFYQSPNTTALLEPFGKWYVKVGYFIIAVFFKYVRFG